MKDIGLQTLMVFLSSLVGIPYSEMDCYELASRFHELQFKRALPKYLYNNPIDSKEISCVVSQKKNQFKKVLNPITGDIILIRVFGLAAHIGIYLEDNKFLHTQDKTGSVIDNVKKWEKRIIGYYRYDQD